MNIRIAKIEDLHIVISLIKDCIKYMDEQNIYQWDELYPNYNIIKKDIQNRSLFLIENNLGMIVLNTNQEPEYKNINWKYQEDDILVVHRLCIHPNSQGKGIAKELMNFAEQYALNNNFKAIRLDAFIKNKIAISLYEKMDYNNAGIVRFKKGDFYCFEKKLIKINSHNSHNKHSQDE